MSIVTYERRGNMGSTRYIMSMGELSRKDNSICFRKNGKNVYIPIENTKELFCLNEVSLNSKLLDFLSQNHVIVHFFNYYGMYSGTFYPKDQYLSGRLLVAQVNKYQTDRLKIAQAIVKVIGDNIADTIEVALENCKLHSENPIVFIGDGSVLYKDLILEKFANKDIRFSDKNIQSSVSLARCAYDKYLKGEYGDSSNISPLYLRKSQAERAMLEQ